MVGQLVSQLVSQLVDRLVGFGLIVRGGGGFCEEITAATKGNLNAVS